MIPHVHRDIGEGHVVQAILERQFTDVAADAALGFEHLVSAALGGVAKVRGQMACFGQRAQVGEDVRQLTRGERLPFESAPFEGLAHAVAVIPHLADEEHRIRQGLPFGDRRGSFGARVRDPVADLATLGREDGLAAPGIAGGIEETLRIEVGEQVGGALRSKLRLLDSGRLDGGPHGGRVVPHGAGEMRGAEIVGCGARQVEADLATAAVDRMALDALLVLEQPRAAVGIAGNHGENVRYGGRQEEETQNECANPGHR